MYFSLQIPWHYAATAKKMQYFFNIVFCRKKLEKNAYIHNNECVLHCCIIKILKDENWPWFYLVLHTIFGKLLMQLSGNHVSPRKRHSQDFHYLHNWHKLLRRLWDWNSFHYCFVFTQRKQVSSSKFPGILKVSKSQKEILASTIFQKTVK